MAEKAIKYMRKKKIFPICQIAAKNRNYFAKNVLGYKIFDCINNLKLP